MATFEKAGPTARHVLERAMELYHNPLHEAKVRVDLLMASPTLNKRGVPTGPAVKLHGRACSAVIRTVSYKDRVKGGGDLEIVIDAGWWGKHEDDEQRIALLDHELTHRKLKLDKHGMVKTDDLGRPKFDAVHHEFEFGWFATTALRHGKKSIEVEQARQMIESDRWRKCFQKFLPGLEPIEATHSDVEAGDEMRVITTTDGRQITPTEMVDELREKFAQDADADMTVTVLDEQVKLVGHQLAESAERIRRPRNAVSKTTGR